MDKPSISVGSFPYAPGFNPYQRLFTSAIEEAGVHVVRIPPEKWFPLQKAAKTECDLLHLDWPHDWYNGKNLLTKSVKTWLYRAGLKHLKRKPTIWTAHNLVAHDSADEHRDHRMIQALINQCRGIMVMSDASQQQLESSYSIPVSTEVRRIFHGHYIDCYENSVSRGQARLELGIQSQQRVFLTLGSIKPYKGHVSLMTAFSRISQPDDLLLVAGGGDIAFVNQLQNRAKELNQRGNGSSIRIEKGLVDDNRLQHFFNAADVTVLPFQNVLNSGSLLLAMSFGSPVVAPKIGSIPEIACPDWFFGYEASDEVDNLANAMLNSGKKINVTEFHQIREAVIRFAREKYNWCKIGSELKHWYAEILDRNG